MKQTQVDRQCVTRSVDLVDVDGLVDSIRQQLGMSQVAQVLQHVHSGIKHGDRVGDVLSCDGCACVSCAGLENSILKTDMSV